MGGAKRKRAEQTSIADVDGGGVAALKAKTAKAKKKKKKKSEALEARALAHGEAATAQRGEFESALAASTAASASAPAKTKKGVASAPRKNCGKTYPDYVLSACSEFADGGKQWALLDGAAKRVQWAKLKIELMKWNSDKTWTPRRVLKVHSNLRRRNSELLRTSDRNRVARDKLAKLTARWERHLDDGDVHFADDADRAECERCYEGRAEKRLADNAAYALERDNAARWERHLVSGDVLFADDADCAECERCYEARAEKRRVAAVAYALARDNAARWERHLDDGDVHFADDADRAECKRCFDKRSVAAKGKFYECYLENSEVFSLTAAEIPEYKRCWEIRDKTHAAERARARAAYAEMKIRGLQSMDLEIADDPALEEQFPHVASYSKASLSSRRADVSVIDGMSYDERIACIAAYEEKLTQLFLFRNKEVEVSEARVKELERAAHKDTESAGVAGSPKRKTFVAAAAAKIFANSCGPAAVATGTLVFLLLWGLAMVDGNEGGVTIWDTFQWYCGKAMSALHFAPHARGGPYSQVLSGAAQLLHGDALVCVGAYEHYGECIIGAATNDCDKKKCHSAASRSPAWKKSTTLCAWSKLRDELAPEIFAALQVLCAAKGMTLAVVSFTQMLPESPIFPDGALMSNIVLSGDTSSWWRVNIKHLSDPRHWKGKWDARKVALASMLKAVVTEVTTATSEE
jgi:hypothetical protein